MPELPEVETSCRGIRPYLEGQKISGLEVRQPRLRWPVPHLLFSILPDNRITAVTRRGKYILLHLTGGEVMIHLGMSGCLRVLPQGTAPEKHDHVDILLESGQMLRLTDPRRFGSVLWQAEGEVHSLLADLGPEPLSDAFNPLYLQQRCSGRKTAIKQVVMDSKVVVGVGNIYANEALFLAGIHPKRPAGNISRQRLTDLVTSIKEVLVAAIEQGGTTLRDFSGSDGKPGYFKQKLNVYGRGGKPCIKCFEPLVEIKLGQRSTVFCRHCQR
ncbi:bifunctional DNA-formamidopyrimidine glycosylase/DNA-(apurinic or apyrimidinic site) lyase [Pontibacter sp. JAM-7]|uniref:bifunctional DNA-formamidopyrimidine glycosylase/DNA-(apurinic or apyrimidinic site) lyase n=1 Tax=Pontibacter sp. JAM-7 TaxID=3366581 RepID=UPI003AF84026